MYKRLQQFWVALAAVPALVLFLVLIFPLLLVMAIEEIGKAALEAVYQAGRPFERKGKNPEPEVKKAHLHIYPAPAAPRAEAEKWERREH